MDVFIYGFSLSFSLILAIGAQNAFVLKQGLKGEHVLLVCSICAISDALLILIGVSGFHLLITAYPQLAQFARFGGALFLIVYGAFSLYAALRKTEVLQPDDSVSSNWLQPALACLAFTWLNPHAYLDTVVLIGSVSTQFSTELEWFASGAVLASAVFFYSLGYGARLLRPIFARPNAWRVLDFIIALVMWGIALKLLTMA